MIKNLEKLILKHGTTIPSPENIDLGELLVQHGENNQGLHTITKVDGEKKLITFPSKEWVTNEIVSNNSDVFDKVELLTKLTNENTFEVPVYEIAKNLPDYITINTHNAYWTNENKSKKRNFIYDNIVNITTQNYSTNIVGLCLNDIVDINTNEMIYLNIPLNDFIDVNILPYIEDMIVNNPYYSIMTNTIYPLGGLNILVHKTLNSKRLFGTLTYSFYGKLNEIDLDDILFGKEYNQNTDCLVSVSEKFNSQSVYTYKGYLSMPQNIFFQQLNQMKLVTAYINDDYELSFIFKPTKTTWYNSFFNESEKPTHNNIYLSLWSHRDLKIILNKKKILLKTKQMTEVVDKLLYTQDKQTIITEDNKNIKL